MPFQSWCVFETQCSRPNLFTLHIVTVVISFCSLHLAYLYIFFLETNRIIANSYLHAMSCIAQYDTSPFEKWLYALL